MPQTIRVAHSPDSDDAFMFYGLFSGAVKADGLEFVQETGDIESLNQRRSEVVHDITAISVPPTPTCTTSTCSSTPAPPSATATAPP